MADLQPTDLGIGQLFELVRDALIVADTSTERIVLWNSIATTIFGYSLQEAIGLPLALLVPEQVRDQHRAGLRRYRATGQGTVIHSAGPVELPAIRKSGEEIVVELSLYPIAQSRAGRRYVLAIVRDISERRQLEEERLRRLQEEAARREAVAAQQRTGGSRGGQCRPRLFVRLRDHPTERRSVGN